MKISNSEFVSEVKLKGEVNICVSNKFGDIISDETVENTVQSGLMVKLTNALCDSDYDWVGSTASNQIAFDSILNAYSPEPAMGQNVPEIGYGDYSSNQQKTGIAIYNTSSYAGYRGMMNGTSAASFSSPYITIVGNAGYNAGTWASAQLGILDSFSISANGTVAWNNEWARTTFTEVTLTTDDMLTISWRLHIVGGA